MNFKNILLLISIISLIFVCVGGVAAHPGHGHEYIEEVSSSSDSPQSAPSHSSSYQQSHSSGSSSGSHNYQSKSSQGVAEKTYSSNGVKSSVNSQNDVSDSGDMNINEVNNSNTTDNTTADEVVEETNPLFSTSNILIYIVVFLVGLFGSIFLIKIFSK
ncbi:hypothetical protein [Methanobrevibacter smithii]|uniref:hypothetical protein n=1 Tax=Methanobrevibacter smithii TaxID=2173 RepID=UPI001FCA5E84|nr:hypothetical protein [Methanobrevibacter smithii]BDF81127.1 hypothetical protein CE91St67_14030 [Methanobrevibacter smithii]BDF82282.1 hypothetical protein CE91St68_08390 [Methanobrevibacter smithii]